MPDGPKISSETLEEDGFGPNKFFHCIVAEIEDKVIKDIKKENNLNLISSSLASVCTTSPTPPGRASQCTWRTCMFSQTTEAREQEQRHQAHFLSKAYFFRGGGIFLKFML